MTELGLVDYESDWLPGWLWKNLVGSHYGPTRAAKVKLNQNVNICSTIL